MTSSEFSRTLRIDTLGETPRDVELKAEEAELKALARRFGLPSIGSLSAQASLVRNGIEVRALGRIRAEVTQACVATAEPVPERVDEEFEILFRPEPASDASDEEVELSESELDVVFYDGASIDLGEAVADTLSLSLDPYPRAPGAAEALHAAGVKTEEEAGPFGALASLRDKLKQQP